MTWRQLSNKISQMPKQLLDEEVVIFPYGNGELEQANELLYVGQVPDIDLQAEDIGDGSYGGPYILTGYAGSN